MSKVCVLAIGTEITLGQIVNRNASWLSCELAKMGIETIGHWVVPDERSLITKMLDLSAELADFIFITGGLGPTTDDFTREVIAKWCDQNLSWNDEAWTWIVKRLSERGITPKDSQKQQCYFPDGAKLLFNNQGTAHGFWTNCKGKNLIVLPGPPKEIQAIWQDGLKNEIQKYFSDIDPLITRSWDTIGVVESEIADLTEKTMQDSGLILGYRVHLPYVEVKVSYRKSQDLDAQKWLQKLEIALKPHTALRDGADATEIFLQSALNKKINIYDDVSNHYLLKKLAPAIRPEHQIYFIATDLFENQKELSANNLYLQLKRTAQGTSLATIQSRALKRQQEFRSPYKSRLMLERESHYFAEHALLFWAQELVR